MRAFLVTVAVMLSWFLLVTVLLWHDDDESLSVPPARTDESGGTANRGSHHALRGGSPARWSIDEARRAHRDA